jgi:hypothetical protein
MARERTRPAIQNEVTETVEREFGSGESAFKVDVEVHTFDPLPFSPSDVLDAAIKAGNVTTEVSYVEFWSNKPSEDDDKWDADKPVKLYRQKYTETKAVNLAGATAIFNGDTAKVFEAVSQTANRNVFQGVYIDMKNASEGPEKAIAKVQKLLKSLSPAQLEAAKGALGLA